MPSVLKKYNRISHLPFLRAKYELIFFIWQDYVDFMFYAVYSL